MIDHVCLEKVYLDEKSNYNPFLGQSEPNRANRKGELAQLFIESEENQRTVGNIYVAKVHKVMSGIRAAFIDMGTPKDAFLHFSDAGDH